MKKVFIVALALSSVFVSCKKEDKCPYSESAAVAPASEITTLQGYLTANGVVATQHPSGVFYNISQPGSGNTATICSTIKTKYRGTLYPSGAGFDSSYVSSPAGVNFTLGQVIAGWQRVVPLLRAGGKMTLYVPPSLGYGDANIRDQNNNLVIPGNSYLKFELELVNIQ